jgi:Asp-tRNA(Asn)/Glu-tRNA(Gln) amidotransferase A subunit family amidase
VIRFCEVRGALDGPLAGRRLSVKDCIAVAGVQMTNGVRRLPAAVPTEDAVVIERLLDAGVVITAKTNLEDMGLGLGEGSAFGASRNPRNPRFSTGGSSSGSGAAVASGLVDIALGADEAGSVRIPSAWCGLVGMKATHGLVPSYGMTYMDHTIDHIGPMTTTVADLYGAHEARQPAIRHTTFARSRTRFRTPRRRPLGQYGAKSLAARLTEGKRMLITAKRLFDGLGDSIVEDPLIEVSEGRIVGVSQRRFRWTVPTWSILVM